MASKILHHRLRIQLLSEFYFKYPQIENTLVS